jgi:predicted methyltransferase
MTFRARALAGSAVIMALSGIVSASAQVREPQVTQSQPATPPTMVSVPSANPFPPLDERAREALRRAVRNEQRIDARRDRWRNPEATLQFFGVRPSDSVVEIWPGQGWFTSIIGPYLKQGDGKLIVGHFDAASSNSKVVRQIVDAYRARFAADPAMYGEVNVVPFGPRSVPMAAPNSVDKVLTFRNIHNWMAQGWTEKAFADFYGILKPGGILGIEEHRGRTDEPQDPLARDGYVREDYVIQLATEAGFEFVGGAEINANPADTKDHPFGVWTLPPVSRSSPIGQPDDPGFDRRRYDEIGESDRMTLRFRKPLDATGVSLASLRPTADQIPVTIIPGPPPPPSPRRARRGILPPPPVVEGAQTQSVEAGTAQVVYPGDGGAAAMAAGLRPAAEDPQAKAAAPPRPSPPTTRCCSRSSTTSPAGSMSAWTRSSGWSPRTTRALPRPAA